MSFDVKLINKRETVKLWAILHGKYDEYVRAYSSEENNLRRYWETMIEPEVQRQCGKDWGENPRLPLHPIGYALMERNGLLPTNQPQKKNDEDFVF